MSGRGLLRYARLTRRQLITFAVLSTVLNGIVTAVVGAWLAQTYASYQGRRASIENISRLVYERRTRAGMVASAIRRNAEIEELRHRKQAYDETYVDWNKNVMLNLFAIREAAGELKISKLEPYFEDGLIGAMADIDRCLTLAYDRRIIGQDSRLILDACRMGPMHQFVLDCGATFTNELYKLTQLSFSPFSGESDAVRQTAEVNIREACTRPTEAMPGPAPSPAPVPLPAAPATPAPQAAVPVPVEPPSPSDTPTPPEPKPATP